MQSKNVVEQIWIKLLSKQIKNEDVTVNKEKIENSN